MTSVTSFHHQPEAQHPNFCAYPQQRRPSTPSKCQFRTSRHLQRSSRAALNAYGPTTCLGVAIDVRLASSDSRPMAHLRMLLAALIAIALALVPAAAPQVSVAHAAPVASSNDGDMPCCVPDHCKSSVGCSAKCLNCGIVAPADQNDPPAIFGVARVSFSQARLHAHVQSPPTHPPPRLSAY